MPISIINAKCVITSLNEISMNERDLHGDRRESILGASMLRVADCESSKCNANRVGCNWVINWSAIVINYEARY
jgi:hypothetical protein